MKTLLINETKRNFILDRLKELNITHTQSGKPIHECDYDRLKEELVLASFRQRDIQADANRWF